MGGVADEPVIVGSMIAVGVIGSVRETVVGIVFRKAVRSLVGIVGALGHHFLLWFWTTILEALGRSGKGL
jgi:CRISPR/Cas system endoribonuclease Cas6 (RAMP superfamily)